MRILFLIRSLANAHGVERTFIDKANFFSEQGHAVLMLTYEQGDHPFAFLLSPQTQHRDLDCKYYQLYKYSIIKRLVETWKMKKVFYKRILSVVRDFQPDILTTTAYSQDFMSEIMQLNNLVPIIVESHSAFYYDNSNKVGLHRLLVRHFLWTLKNCRLIIALTNGDARFWSRYVKNVKVVPNPLSFYIEDVSHYRRIDNRIVCAGQLYAPKRFDRMIEAFSKVADKFPEWYIDVYGDGEDRDILESMIKAFGLEGKVLLHPRTDNIAEEFLTSQFFVSSSDFEGFSLVIIEAMACGLPVLSTNCPYGPGEIIENGVTGMLCELTVDDLANKMEWMITHHAERLKIGERGYQAAAKYKKEIIMKEWEAAYRSVLR